VSRVVLVTGAAGGIGRALMPALRSRRWRVRCLVHRRPVADADEVVTGDLADSASLEPAVAGADAILHLAARTHARREADYAEANVEGTRRLLDAAAAARVGRFVQVSTRAIDASGGAYSRSKRAAEGLVEASGLVWTIVRLPEVYGADSAEGVDDVIARGRRGAPIAVVGRGEDVVCPIHVDDAVGALAAALAAPAAAGKVYTLAGECLTMRELADVSAQTFGQRSRIVSVPTPVLRLVSHVARVVALPLYPDQLDRLRAPKPPGSPEARVDLGFAPCALADGLRRLG
jgi:nucleoside-diphosphate-sugar epimerase